MDKPGELMSIERVTRSSERLAKLVELVAPPNIIFREARILIDAALAVVEEVLSADVQDRLAKWRASRDDQTTKGEPDG